MLVLGCVYFLVFSNSLKRWKIEIFEKPRLHFKILPNSLKSLKIEIFVPFLSPFVAFMFCQQMVAMVFQYDMWHQRNQFMIKLAIFKKKWKYNNVGNNLVSVSKLEILFPDINEGINWKMFLLKLCMSLDPLARYLHTTWNESHFPARSSFAYILPICIVIFPIIDQIRYFFSSIMIRSLSSNVLLVFEQRRYRNLIKRR